MHQLYLSETLVSTNVWEFTGGSVGGFVVVSLWRRACGEVGLGLGSCCSSVSKV